MIGKSFSSLLAAAGGFLVVTGVVLVAGAGSALACVPDTDGDCFHPNYHVQRTDGSLAQWSGPGTGRIVSSLGGDGTPVEVVCETTGATEDGLPYVVWDQLDDGTYVYGYYLDTPGDGYHPALTLCSGSPTPAPQPPQSGPPPRPGPPPHPVLQCPSAPAAVPQPPGAGPAPGSGPRPGLLIDHAQWVYARYQDNPPRCGWSLHVTPTLLARLSAGSFGAAWQGWNELYADYKNVGRGIKQNVDGLKNQYVCHQVFVAVHSPRKVTWDLDEWRPDVDFWATVRASCNP
jgi:hypothetical protein